MIKRDILSYSVNSNIQDLVKHETVEDPENIQWTIIAINDTHCEYSMAWLCLKFPIQTVFEHVRNKSRNLLMNLWKFE